MAKFVDESPMSGFAAAARAPKGGSGRPPPSGRFSCRALSEMDALAHAQGVPGPYDLKEQFLRYVAPVSPNMRPSLLVDLSRGKRLEVEVLLGSVVRRRQVRGAGSQGTLAMPTPTRLQ